MTTDPTDVQPDDAARVRRHRKTTGAVLAASALTLLTLVILRLWLGSGGR